jgi:2-aminoadipate transaminase
MISFRRGICRIAEIFPVEQFQEAASVISREGKDILQYGTTEGYPPLKEFIPNGPFPVRAESLPEEILITTGSSQIIDLLCWALVDRGD